MLYFSADFLLDDFCSFFSLASALALRSAVPGALATFVYRINSAGDIVGEYDDPTTAHGFLLCNRDHADAEGCGENAQGTTAAQGQTSKSPWVTLPENVRKLLLQRRGFGQFGAGLVDRLER